MGGGSVMLSLLTNPRTKFLALSLVLCVSVNPTSCEMFIWIPRSLRPHLEIQRHVICPEHFYSNLTLPQPKHVSCPRLREHGSVLRGQLESPLAEAGHVLGAELAPA